MAGINKKLNRIIHHTFANGKETKAGLWQATSIYKDQLMLVYRNVTFTVSVNGQAMLDNLGADVEWAEEHFQERISGVPSNPGESYKRWPYNTFTPENDPYMHGEEFSHTYQERFWPKEAGTGKPFMGDNFHVGIRYNLGDLNDVIRQLKDNPLTRQAYLPIFFPEDTGAIHKQRVPCTLGYYFWIEDNKLHMNYIIRSCDVLRHLRNDMYLTARLLQHVAYKLQIESGELTFIIFNLHLFKNDKYALIKKEKALNNEYFKQNQ